MEDYNKVKLCRFIYFAITVMLIRPLQTSRIINRASRQVYKGIYLQVLCTVSGNLFKLFK